MTTLTTARPIVLLPSFILPGSMTCNERLLLNKETAIPHLMMHPDNLLLHNHGVTSPRLSSTSSAGSSTNIPFKNCDSPPTSLQRIKDASHNSEQESGIISILSPSNSNRESIANPFQFMSSNNNNNDSHIEIATSNHEDDDVTDRMSCCSEDSELSVGQECCDNPDNEHILNHQNCVANIVNNSNNRLCNSSSFSGKPMNDDSESVDNISSLSDENRVTSVSENLANDEMSNSSSPNRDIASDPIMMAATGIRIPAPIIRPSPTRIQEEFLRKSHLYAEELMKQQMQFMAAARVSAFSLRHPALTPEFGKIGFRPHMKQQGEINDSILNMNGIHSHLSAISKISSQLTSNESVISKLTAFGSSRETSQSPPSLNQFHGQHPIHQHNPFINNDLNESNLKFSIDNILKADFGRRITDPLLKRSNNSSNSNCGSSKGSNSRKNSNKSVERTIEKNSTPVDLTNVVSQQSIHTNDTSNSNLINNSVNNATTTSVISTNDKHHHSLTPNKSSTGSTQIAGASSITSQISSTSSSTSTSSTSTSTNLSSESNNNNNGNNSSSGSVGPMAWPAWVYCTRYSDRPSSGPRTRKPKKSPGEKGSSSADEKRPRTAFSGPQLARLRHEFSENRYLTERRRQQLSAELGLNEAQIKIWFQNKRAKIKKASGTKNPLALQLMAQGLYNHSTVPLTREEEELQELQAKSTA